MFKLTLWPESKTVLSIKEKLYIQELELAEAKERLEEMERNLKLVHSAVIEIASSVELDTDESEFESKYAA